MTGNRRASRLARIDPASRVETIKWVLAKNEDNADGKAWRQ
jgi:hypothetical protein